MKNIVLILGTLLSIASSILPPPVDKETLITLPKLTEDYGYPTTEYTVNTKDGYSINMYRMSGKTPVVEDLPIFLLHGIIGSAEDLLRMGPNQSLGYLLVDQGYDVWLGNLRGNLYTSHEKMDKSDVEFWKFCYDEHGKYDLPPMLEKVLEVTQAPKLHFIGYSMGTTSYFIMCDSRPDLAAKIETFIALAPITSLGPRIKLISQVARAINFPKISERLGLTALIYNEPLQRFVVSTLCHNRRNTNDLCYTITHLLTGVDYEQIVWEKARVIFSKLQPASLKQLVHYAQLALTGNFSAFDWGPKGNMKRYGQEYPPLYNLSANIAPTALFYGENDLLATSPNSVRLSRKLHVHNQKVIMKPIRYKKFNHFDFLFSRDIKILLNDDIINTIPILRAARNQNEI